MSSGGGGRVAGLGPVWSPGVGGAGHGRCWRCNVASKDNY